MFSPGSIKQGFLPVVFKPQLTLKLIQPFIIIAPVHSCEIENDDACCKQISIVYRVGCGVFTTNHHRIPLFMITIND